ncbi:Rhs element Vgr protein [Calothrix sp. NIES-4101]|nr:Rhs element Vgr protein [Calothrix sp. NIES-4101]
MNATVHTKKYYGKYAGTVLQNVDPEQRGRLQLTIPDAIGFIPSTWAEPCLPLAGTIGLAMGTYFIPPIGAGVWVEFEHGDLNRPIWVGCRYGSTADVPAIALAAPPATPPIVLQSMTQNKAIFSSVPGDGITLETGLGPAGPSIKITPVGIIISDGKGAMITLSAGIVTINQGALVIK